MTFRLTVISSDGKQGRSFDLKGKRTITIGAKRGSDIQIQGQSVSAEHAIVEVGGEAGFILTNLSEYGTWVDREPIRAMRLVPGQHIQFGDAPMLFLFEERESKKTKRSSSTASPSSSADKKSGKRGSVRTRPMVIGGAIYLTLIIVLAVWLSERDTSKDAGSLSIGQLKDDLALSQKQLGGDDFLTGLNDGASVSPNGDAGAGFGSGADYYRLVALRQGSPTLTSDQEQLIATMLSNVEERIFRAWALEQQGLSSDAANEYHEVERIIPDIRIKITQLAVSREQALSKAGGEGEGAHVTNIGDDEFGDIVAKVGGR